MSVVTPQALLRARLRLERPHPERIQNYISHGQQLQFYLCLTAAGRDLTTVFQAANRMHTLNTAPKPACSITLGIAFIAEAVISPEWFEGHNREQQTGKSCEVRKKCLNWYKNGAKRKSYGDDAEGRQQ